VYPFTKPENLIRMSLGVNDRNRHSVSDSATYRPLRVRATLRDRRMALHPEHHASMALRDPILDGPPDRRTALDTARSFNPSFKRDFTMSDCPQAIAFETDATEALLSMLRKAALCSDMLPEERVEIATLKFLALRARLRAERGEATVAPRATPARVPTGLRRAAPTTDPTGGPSPKYVDHSRVIQ
jgi:hypothetical protein